LPTSGVPEHLQTHISEAWQQLTAGKKPTADSVLRRVGGSKATAVVALQQVWGDYLPILLAWPYRRTPGTDHPARHLLWAKADRLATDRAEAAVAGERAALQAAQKAID
jgi:hypothetical protein